MTRLGIDEKLERAEAPVTDGRRHPLRSRDDLCAHFRVEVRRRRDLDQLLIAALDRALALAEVGHALPVTDDLHFDVTGPTDQLLDVKFAVAECALCLGGTAGEGLGQVIARSDSPHAPPSAAGDGLHHHRAIQTEIGQERGCLIERRRPTRAPQYRDTMIRGERAGAGLVAEQRERVWSRADERGACGGACAREGRVLGQESVARMDQVGVSLRRGVDNAGDVEVGGRTAPSERNRLVGHPHMQAQRVVLGVHRDRGDPEIGRGPDDADGDLAPVGNEQLGGHGCTWYHCRALRPNPQTPQVCIVGHAWDSCGRVAPCRPPPARLRPRRCDRRVRHLGRRQRPAVVCAPGGGGARARIRPARRPGHADRLRQEPRRPRRHPAGTEPRRTLRVDRADQSARGREVLRARRSPRPDRGRPGHRRRVDQPRSSRAGVHGRGVREPGTRLRRRHGHPLRVPRRVPLLRRPRPRLGLAGAAPAAARLPVPARLGHARRRQCDRHRPLGTHRTRSRRGHLRGPADTAVPPVAQHPCRRLDHRGRGEGPVARLPRAHHATGGHRAGTVARQPPPHDAGTARSNRGRSGR